MDESSFAQLLSKPANELWIVDYFAPWCGPCQKLAPQIRKLAKEVKKITETQFSSFLFTTLFKITYLDFVRVAQVDCEANGELCTSQNIRSYPTVRLYPLNSKGLNTVA